MRLVRIVWCILVKWLAPFKSIARHAVKRRLKKVHDLAESRVQKIRYQNMVVVSPYLRNAEKVKDLLRLPAFFSFVCLATAHYNEMLDRVHRAPNGYAYYAKENDFEEMVNLAESYFIRNRSRLVEWWCLNTSDGQVFWTDEDKVNCDINNFNAAFKEKCHRMNIVAGIDNDGGHYSALDSSYVDSLSFMASVACRATRIGLAFPC